MKKLVAYTASFALAMSVSIAMPAAASAEAGGSSDAAQACQSSSLTVGTCVNLSHGFDAHSFCMLLKDVGVVANLGQCTKALKPILG